MENTNLKELEELKISLNKKVKHSDLFFCLMIIFNLVVLDIFLGSAYSEKQINSFFIISVKELLTLDNFIIIFAFLIMIIGFYLLIILLSVIITYAILGGLNKEPASYNYLFNSHFNKELFKIDYSKDTVDFTKLSDNELARLLSLNKEYTNLSKSDKFLNSSEKIQSEITEYYSKEFINALNPDTIIKYKFVFNKLDLIDLFDNIDIYNKLKKYNKKTTNKDLNVSFSVDFNKEHLINIIKLDIKDLMEYVLTLLEHQTNSEEESLISNNENKENEKSFKNVDDFNNFVKENQK